MSAEMPSTALATSEIIADASTQWRESNSDEAIAEMADLLRAGGTLPAIDVFDDGKVKRVADGHHRLAAYVLSGTPQIAARVHRGDADAAFLFGVRAGIGNKSVRALRSDVRHAALEMMRRPGIAMSIHLVAETLRVPKSTVHDWRRAWVESGALSDSDSRVGRDGRTINTANIGKAHRFDPNDLRLHEVIAHEPYARQHREALAAEKNKPAFVPLDDAEREAFAKCEALGTQTEIPAQAYVPVATDDDWSGEPSESEVFDGTAPPAPEPPRPTAREYAAIDEGRAMREIQAVCDAATTTLRGALDRYPLANYRTEALREGAIGALVRLAGFLTDQLPAAARPPEDNRRGFVALKGGK